MSELRELVSAALDAATDGEQVEAYAEEERRTEVSALRGEVEGMTFAESRGVGVRVIRDERLGYAWAADPTEDEVRAAVAAARQNAALAEPDPSNGLPDAVAVEPMPELFRAESAAITADDKVRMALDLERYTVARDPRVTKVDLAQVGDEVSRVAVASTTGVDLAYERTDAWVVAVTLAVEGDDTQTGFSFTIARGLDQLAWEPIADEAVDRAVQMLGRRQTGDREGAGDPRPLRGVELPRRARRRAERRQRLEGTLAVRRHGRPGGRARRPSRCIDDGRRADGPGACPFDGEGVPSGRTELFTAGVLNGFLHSTYTAHRAGNGQRSTGNAKRGGYKSAPGVGTSNFFVEAGDRSFDALRAEAGGGVLIMDVSGVHSGANPISGEFSVGATGRRIGADGSLGEPLREMTIASTLPEMLQGVRAVGSDLRFFSSVGTPSILIGEMTLAGV